ETYDDPLYYDDNNEVVEIPFADHSYFLKSADAFDDHIVGGLCDWVYYTDEGIACDDKGMKTAIYSVAWQVPKP
ncbi:MAG: hypothetical protein IKR46_01425, partial [Clostridia bacterium]|nr:hypothetical protein [Clostridia bacterium]